MQRGICCPHCVVSFPTICSGFPVWSDWQWWRLLPAPLGGWVGALVTGPLCVDPPGKVAIRKEDLQKYHNRDTWFQLQHVDADSEVQVRRRGARGTWGPWRRGPTAVRDIDAGLQSAEGARLSKLSPAYVLLGSCIWFVPLVTEGKERIGEKT